MSYVKLVCWGFRIRSTATWFFTFLKAFLSYLGLLICLFRLNWADKIFHCPNIASFINMREDSLPNSRLLLDALHPSLFSSLCCHASNIRCLSFWDLLLTSATDRRSKSAFPCTHNPHILLLLICSSEIRCSKLSLSCVLNIILSENLIPLEDASIHAFLPLLPL